MKKSKLLTLFLVAGAVLLQPLSSNGTSGAQAAALPADYRIFGDINNDKKINDTDVLLVRHHISASSNADIRASHPDWILKGENLKMADVNGNGAVTKADLARIIQHTAVVKGESSDQSQRIVTVYFNYGKAVNRSGSFRKAYAGNSALGDVDRDYLKDPKYTFIGWYTSPTGGTRVRSTSNVGTGNKILYAHYKLSSVSVTGVTLSKTSASVVVGSRTKLTAAVKPSNASNKEVTWTSSNPAVATVSSGGVVTGVKAGRCVISVKTKDKNKTAKAVITVTEVPGNFSGWHSSGGKWYLYQNGRKLTGWQENGGKKYYLDPKTGVMKTGWTQIDGKWYYFDSSGAMLTGWQQIGGKWYYLDSSGKMLTDLQDIGGKTYYLDHTNGDMKTGWVYVPYYTPNGYAYSEYYYFDASGAAVKGQWVGDYYLTASGAMAAYKWVDTSEGSVFVDKSGKKTVLHGYTITFRANGGHFASYENPRPDTVTRVITPDLPIGIEGINTNGIPQAGRDGYRPAGFSLTPDGERIDGDIESYLAYERLNGDMTLYVRWKDSSYPEGVHID